MEIIKNRQEHQDEWRDVKIHPIGFLSTTKVPLGHHINTGIIIIIFSPFFGGSYFLSSIGLNSNLSLSELNTGVCIEIRRK